MIPCMAKPGNSYSKCAANSNASTSASATCKLLVPINLTTTY